MGLLEGLKAEIEKLCDTDPGALRDQATIIEFNRSVACLNAINARVTVAFDTAREWETDGARTAASWIRTRCGIPGFTARRRVRLERATSPPPAG